MHPALRPITSLIGPRGSGKSSVGKRLAARLNAELVDLDDALTQLHSAESGESWPGAGEILAALGEEAFRDLESRALVQVLTRYGPAGGPGTGEDPPHRVGSAESPGSNGPGTVGPGTNGPGTNGPGATGEGPAHGASFIPPRIVLATGGGVVERASNRERLRQETGCVRLVVEAARLRERLAADPTSRPALMGSDPLLEIEAVLERREALYNETSHFTLDCGADDMEQLTARILTWLETPS